MSTSFDVETRSDRTPTVQELMDALFSLPQFARTGIRRVHFNTLELYTPRDESQIGFGLLGKCDWGDIEAEILDSKLIYLGGVDVMSPWDYDKCREEWYEAAGSYERFDNENYAL